MQCPDCKNEVEMYEFASFDKSADIVEIEYKCTNKKCGTVFFGTLYRGDQKEVLVLLKN